MRISSPAGSPKARAAVGKAVKWLKRAQEDNGSFGGGPTTEASNANSTGLAAWALASADWCPNAAKAARWIGKLTVTGNVSGTPLAGEKGAIAYDQAALQTAQARAEVSKSAFQRARNLGAYATQVQVETAEGTYQTDQAALSAAQSQLRTLAATAQQEWGPVIGKAIVERSTVVTRLIERTDFLVQVTLPPGETLKGRPDTAFAEVPPQSERVALRYVSPGTRTDQRIQGVSLFYLVSGDSGLLPGMSTLAFITADRAVEGILVPEDAVVHWQGGAWFYREVGEDGFARHPLPPNAAMSADAYVVGDLGQETEIVVGGAQALLSEEARAQAPATMDDDD